MSRTRKKPNPRRSSRPFGICRRGCCSWCDGNRQHNKLKTEEHTVQDVEDYLEDAPDWFDYE